MVGIDVSNILRMARAAAAKYGDKFEMKLIKKALVIDEKLFNELDKFQNIVNAASAHARQFKETQLANELQAINTRILTLKSLVGGRM
jgi:hypothetical protein